MRSLCIFSAAALMFFAACSRAISPGVSVDSSLRGMIPVDATVLAGIEFRKITQTELYQKHQRELSIPLLDASAERIGLDLRKDVSELVIAWTGNQPLAFVKGRLNVEKIKPNLLSLGGQETKYEGKTLIGTPQSSVLFLDGDTVAVGGSQALKSMSRSELPEELARGMRRLPRNDQIWVVSRKGLPFVNLPMRSDVQSALSNVVSYVSTSDIGLAMDSGLHLIADFNCASDVGAQRVNDALRAGIGLGRLTTKDSEMDLLKAYDAIKVQKDGQTVRVTADWPPQVVDKLLTMLNGRLH